MKQGNSWMGQNVVRESGEKRRRGGRREERWELTGRAYLIGIISSKKFTFRLLLCESTYRTVTGHSLVGHVIGRISSVPQRGVYKRSSSQPIIVTFKIESPINPGTRYDYFQHFSQIFHNL